MQGRRCTRFKLPSSAPGLAGRLTAGASWSFVLTSHIPVHRLAKALYHQGVNVLAVEKLPRGKAAGDCPAGRLWVTDFLKIKPEELPRVHYMHVSCAEQGSNP